MIRPGRAGRCARSSSSPRSCPRPSSSARSGRQGAAAVQIAATGRGPVARPVRARLEPDRHWRRGRAAIAIDAPGFRFGGRDQFDFRSRAVRGVPGGRARFPGQVSESGFRVRFSSQVYVSGIRVRLPKLGPSSHFPSQAESGPPVARELGCQSRRLGLGCQPRRLGCQSRRLGCQSWRRYCGRFRFPSQVSRSDSPAEVCLDCLSQRLRVDFHEIVLLCPFRVRIGAGIHSI